MPKFTSVVKKLMKGGWWRGEIRKDERLRGRGRERETEIEVKDEMQWWVVGGRGGRRKLKMRESRKERAEIQNDTSLVQYEASCTTNAKQPEIVYVQFK